MWMRTWPFHANRCVETEQNNGLGAPALAGLVDAIFGIADIGPYTRQWLH